MPTHQRRYACVCASNVNRSLAGHVALLNAGFTNISSYGTGSSVKLPGIAYDKPNVYAFNTPYDYMFSDLQTQNEQLYRNNGILKMLDRNRNVKYAPERFQENFKSGFDVIITFEDRVFDAVINDFASNRKPVSFTPVYVINLETKDTHSDAEVGAIVTVQLVELLDAAEDLDNEIEGILEMFEDQTGQHLVYLPQFY